MSTDWRHITMIFFHDYIQKELQLKFDFRLEFFRMLVWHISRLIWKRICSWNLTVEIPLLSDFSYKFQDSFYIHEALAF